MIENGTVCMFCYAHQIRNVWYSFYVPLFNTLRDNLFSLDT